MLLGTPSKLDSSVKSTSNRQESPVTIDHYDTIGGRERESIGKVEISRPD